MELYEAVMTTRSMRRLTDDPPVTDEDIEHCLRAAAQAPSGGNVQPYHFIVLTDAGCSGRHGGHLPAELASLPLGCSWPASGPFRSPEPPRRRTGGASS